MRRLDHTADLSVPKDRNEPVIVPIHICQCGDIIIRFPHTERQNGGTPVCPACVAENRRDRKYRQKVRRKRLLATAESEFYRRRDIYERDGWICRLCNEPVEDTDDRNGDWAASIDHIVALSAGGSDTPENVQLAHRWCNAVKHRGEFSLAV